MGESRTPALRSFTELQDGKDRSQQGKVLIPSLRGHTMGSDEERTDEEQAVLDKIAERKCEEYAEEYAELILAQARRVGTL